MKLKLPALLALCLLVFAGTADALEIDELIAVTAMPLAVADVIALPDVPRQEVITVVTTLNQAAVPAPQFVEIVRYVPMALVEPAEPRFVTYVTQEYQRGIVGEPLALAIADRYSNTYGIEEFHIVDPPVMTVVERREILPQMVVTRFQPVEFDPLALIAMPLAVAAVADIADVPTTDLMRFVASLNQAMVPAPQFVEVVRYSPVVFVDRTASPQFLQFVTTEVDRGVIGRPLAFAIADRFETFEPIDIDIIAPQPRLIVQRDEILPAVVVNRIASTHPHGGPPGQLKKQLGLQTGAEVVHGTRTRRVPQTRTVVVRGDNDRDDGRSRRERVTRERRSAPSVRRDDDRPRAKTRVVRPERSERSVRSGNSGRGNRSGETRVRQEQRRPEKARVSGSSGSRGKSGASGSAKGQGNTGSKGSKGSGSKGNKGKGKG